MSQLSTAILSPDQITVLRNALYSVAGIAEALDDASFARGQDYTLSDNTASATRIHAALPINEDAASAWYDLKHILVAWASLIGNEKTRRYIVVNTKTGRPKILPDGRADIRDGDPIGVSCGGSLSELADFIVEHLDWLASHSAAQDAFEELTGSIADASMAARMTPVERVERVLPEDAQSLALVHGDVASYPQDISRQLMKKGIPVSLQNIQDWARRKKLFPTNPDDDARKKYNMSDVLAVYKLMSDKRELVA